MLTVSGLTKAYGKVRAVDSLSFTANDGQVTGFVGPNGAGKSTAMRSMLGLDFPTSGDARIDGRHIDEFDQPARAVGSLLDASWVHPGRTARNHLLWMAQMAGVSTSVVDPALDRVGLTAVAKKRLKGFSLGMRQRLGVAGALLGAPRNLIFDEPLNGLDPEGVHWMRELMREYAKHGGCVLVSSHLLSELSMTADRLVIIGRGQLIGDFNTADFIKQYSLTSVKVRVDQPHVLAEVLEGQGYSVAVDPQTGVINVSGGGVSTDIVAGYAKEKDLTVLELAQVEGSLEEAFLRLTSGSVEYRSSDSVRGL